MGSWEEIRRLAADLQRVQLGVSSKKLSDRNCIEVVSKLIDLSLIDVIFTIDGREYVTRNYFYTQIKDECLANKGRVSLADLQQQLNIDYPKIDDACNEIAKNDPNYLLSMGLLISREYLDLICVDINDKLGEEGTLNMSNITKMFDLPAELLRSHILSSLGTKIKGFSDSDNPSILYTNDYVHEQKCVIRGYLSGLSKITQIQKVLQDLSISANLFFRCVDELSGVGELRGSISGGRHSDRGYYTPHMYTTLLKAYVKQQYAQSGIIELSSLRKLGVGDSGQYIKDMFVGEHLTTLSTIVLSQESWNQVVNNVTDKMIAQHWCSINESLPVEATPQSDAPVASDIIVETNKLWFTCDELKQIDGFENDCDDCCVYDEQLVNDCFSALEPLVAQKASSEAQNVSKILKELQKNETNAPSDSKKKGGKKGGKGKKNRDDTENELHNTNEVTSKQSVFKFMSDLEIKTALRERPAYSDCPGGILIEVSERIKPKLDDKYKQTLESVLLVEQADTASQQKRSFADFANQFKNQYWEICVLDEGAGVFGDLVCAHLRTYLLKSNCSHLANNCLAYVAGVPNQNQMTPKVINSTIDSMSNTKARDAFRSLFNTLNCKSETLNDFYSALELIADPSVCSLNLKAADKKTKMELVKNRAVELRKQLVECTDAAQGLLIILIILLADNLCISVHASGKFVPNIMDKIEKFVDPEMFNRLSDVQNLVVKSLKKSQSTPELVQELSVKFQDLKSIVLTEK